MQQQEPGVAWCHIGGHKQVVEPVHSLHQTGVKAKHRPQQQQSVMA
jgi:hypothetical protein